MKNFIELKKVTTAMFEQNPIEEHPFCKALADDQINQAQCREAALQIYQVVLHFPRFLSAILTNIPDYKVRMPLVENLFEEHGKMNAAYVHSETYRTFLLGIGISEEEIKNAEASVPVLAYTRAVTDLCLHYNFLEGLAALGVIEEIVARVSPIVGQYCNRNFMTAGKSLFHFTSHETLDVEHANEIYEVVALFYEGENKKVIERGLQLGMYYHRRLYSNIMGMLSTREPNLEVSEIL
jgi:pyrroloquinoline-quinone synthase